ncbi:MULTISPECIES: hypothetical protein [unclassified Cryobacterium]|uniref:hypothetical protein n=1 Tax=unclassified Cryobacterium TaxID=2649013 RepID=UPI002AB5D0AC|nr:MULTISPECIES: hypothetical protein [unclassified Cryobacterium]MDY7526811.1 hypothetical protein [Cryobacterium sp. 10C2]MDY7557388.1 hypothetical protein [Cryobacterium sp. 10C3]MEB0291587.1 hypothetical protein [Cryobacterium sp. 10C2]
MDEVAAAVGTHVTSWAAARASSLAENPYYAVVPARGGIDCQWSVEESPTSAYLSAVVVAAASVPTDTVDQIACYGADVADSAESGACRISATVAGYWLSADVYTAVGTVNEDARNAATKLVATFSGRALAAGTPEVAATPIGAWEREDCAALSTAADITHAVSSPGLAVRSNDSEGTEGSEGRFAAKTSTGAFACGWSQSPIPEGQIGSFSVIALPGGAWAQEDIARTTGAEKVSIPGVDGVIRIPNEAGGYTFDVFDGVNWLQLSADISAESNLDQLIPAIPALVNVLNAA